MPILGSFTCKNNAHSKRADAQLLSKDGKERGDRSCGREEKEEVALGHNITVLFKTCSKCFFFPAILQGGQWGFSLTAFSQFFFDPFPNIREILKVVDKC